MHGRGHLEASEPQVARNHLPYVEPRKLGRRAHALRQLAQVPRQLDLDWDVRILVKVDARRVRRSKLAQEGLLVLPKIRLKIGAAIKPHPAAPAAAAAGDAKAAEVTTRASAPVTVAAAAPVTVAAAVAIAAAIAIPTRGWGGSEGAQVAAAAVAVATSTVAATAIAAAVAASRGRRRCSPRRIHKISERSATAGSGSSACARMFKAEA